MKLNPLSVKNIRCVLRDGTREEKLEIARALGAQIGRFTGEVGKERGDVYGTREHAVSIGRRTVWFYQGTPDPQVGALRAGRGDLPEIEEAFLSGYGDGYGKGSGAVWAAIAGTEGRVVEVGEVKAAFKSRDLYRYRKVAEEQHGYIPEDADLVEGVIAYATRADWSLEDIIKNPGGAADEAAAHDAAEPIDDGYSRYL